MTSPTTIESAYTTQHAAALAQLQAIQSIIESMPAPDTAKLHWGHVGSMTEVNRQLGQTLQFVLGSTAA